MNRDPGAEIAALVARFAGAWRSETPPKLEVFLPADSLLRRQALPELIAIDIEHRWKRASAHPTASTGSALVDTEAGKGDSVRPTLEDYCLLFPELGPIESLPFALIAAEYRARQRFGDRPAHEEYLARFPLRGSELCAQLGAVDQELAKLGATPPWQSHGSDSSSDPQMKPLPARLGRYVPIRSLGAGGLGEVYLAHDPQLNRHVAVKVPRRDLEKSPAEIDAYLAEAQIVAGLDHQNIVPVYDAGRTHDGSCFVVSKFIEGNDLRHSMRKGRMLPDEAAALVAHVADALHHAHKLGIIHRDVKPENILLDVAGCPMLADFGLALRPEDFGRSAGYCGTVAYMSTEQAAGRANKVDGRSDIYSLGVVLYELVTGKLPYRGRDAVGLRAEIADEKVEVLPPRQVYDQVPGELERVCLKALAKRQNDRYTTAGDLAAALREFLAARGTAQADRQSPPTARGRLSPQRVLALVVVTLILAGAAAWTVAWFTRPTSLAETPPADGGNPSVPLQVSSLEVQHFEKLPRRDATGLGAVAMPRGALGKESFIARVDDQVTVRAKLSRPAYAYVLAFRPDGEVELCFPEEDEAPPLTDQPTYPWKARDVRYGLHEGAGLWVFAVLASDEPLPSYQQWLAERGSPDWEPFNTENPIVFWDDGQWVEELSLGHRRRDKRAKGVLADERTHVVRIANWLRGNPGIGGDDSNADRAQAAAALGFTVLPREAE